ncbi:UNKNOWN [Stylonychia lemnae]|uniref:Uncharacterized protein n=1 Tax=Stylonychia lemnae TaxID=5949 RepID=A0A078B4G4_STYLE|nr:UNKNOWN [Stylonychia lemnae]|eukprot:CDW89405.1 UNKNOWN [Stylonychia lemnae]
MHRPDSQTEIINTYLREKINNPLIYEEVEYDKSEWDNIPWIIPRYCIHLSKHLESLTEHYKEKCSEETTKELRESLTADIQVAENLVYQEKHDREYNCQRLQDEIKKVKDELGELKEKLQREKFDCVMKARSGLVENLVKDEREKQRMEFESRKFLQNDTFLNKDNKDYVEPRQFSIYQIRELFFSFDNKKEYHDHLKEYYRVLEQDHDSLTFLKDKQKHMLRELDDNKGFQDLCNSKFEKNNLRLTSLNEKFEGKLENMKQKFEQLVKENDKKLFDLKDSMMQSIEVTKHHIYDQIDYVKDQQTQVMRQELDQYSSKIEEFKQKLVDKMHLLNTKTKEKIIKIKEICSNFFKSYEDSLIQMKNQFVEVHDAFQSWNRNVVQPNQVKEATLYSLEQQFGDFKSQDVHFRERSQNLRMHKSQKVELNSLSLKQQPSGGSPSRQQFFNREQELIDIEAENASKAAELLLAKRLLFLRQKLNTVSEKQNDENLLNYNDPSAINNNKRLIADDSYNILQKFNKKKRNDNNRFVKSQQVSPINSGSQSVNLGNLNFSQQAQIVSSNLKVPPLLGQINIQDNNISELIQNVNIPTNISSQKKISVNMAGIKHLNPSDNLLSQDINESSLQKSFDNTSSKTQKLKDSSREINQLKKTSTSNLNLNINDKKNRIDKLKNLSLSQFEKSKFISDFDVQKEDEKLQSKMQKQNSKLRLKNLDYFGAIDNKVNFDQ